VKLSSGGLAAGSSQGQPGKAPDVLGPVEELKPVAVMGLACPWLCVPGKPACTEHPVWEPGSMACWLAGRLPRAGAVHPLSPESFSKRLCGGVDVSVAEAAFLEAEVFLRAPALPPFSRRANCSGGFPRAPASG